MITVHHTKKPEPRYGYATSRRDQTIVPKTVVEVTHLPASKKASLPLSVASEDFLTRMRLEGYAVRVRGTTLIQAGHTRKGTVNAHAAQAAGRAGQNHPMCGPFYRVDATAHRETWWRTSVRLDFDPMPGVKKGKGGNRQDMMRIALHQQIAGSGITFGPFFVETVWSHADSRRYWFDIYAQSQSDLTTIMLTL